MRKIHAIIIVILTLAVMGCKNATTPEATPKNSAKALTAFSFPSLTSTGVVNESAKTITVTVPFGTSVIALIPFVTHTGTNLSPASGVACDFTQPVTYTVTAEDGSSQLYVVTVTITQPGTITALLKLYDTVNTATPANTWAGYDFIKTNTGANLSVTFQSTIESEQDSAILALANANNLPDILEVNRSVWVTLVDSGKIAPVDDLLASMPNRSANMYSQVQFRTIATRNGKLYAFPQAILMANEGLVIRKDWLDALGLSVPTNLTELTKVLKAFTENDPDGNGIADTYGLAGDIETPAWREGGLGFRFAFIFGAYGVPGILDTSSSANFGLTVRKPEFLAALTYIKSLYDSKYIWPGTFNATKDIYRTFWKTGKVGMIVEQNAALHLEANYTPFNTACPNGNWIVIDPPKGPDGKSASEGPVLYTPRYLVVSQKAIDEGRGPAIAKLLEWMAGDTAHMYFLFGTAGVNYTLSGDVVSTTGISGTSYSTASFASNRQLGFLVERLDALELKPRYPAYTMGGRTFSSYDTLAAIRSKAHTDVSVTSICTTNALIKTQITQGVVGFILGKDNDWPTVLTALDTAGAASWEATMKSELLSNGLLK